ncbi:prepilin-type N-terminal cleavage/methylation domain-containing protein [Caldicoprobacter algeriensis]|uniref:type II secretion system protein n=1 Tax=Caldicoprobacter algeriensis TaxID=699281 RepID=UPI002079E489|nr:prepilin-type N-terminal cleavage/methylation domain-containing protein [Caldicoprobacter algeriensis]MCM8900918.1 prepilin-type N-terminal cleavage/methylation domain-containing protein [Caldicoprobacter algeriensis]
MFKRFRKNKKGFTLIELVVVIAILGVLALLITPNVVNRIDEAEKAVDKANLEMIQKAIEMYYIEYGEYPQVDNFADLQPYLTQDSEENKYIKLLDEWPELKSITGVTYDKKTGKLTYQD